MSEKHEVSCWHCHEMTSLETRNEFDGCCWACGAEINLEEYLVRAMDKRDEHYAALSAVTAERDGANERAGLLLDAKNHWADRTRAAEAERDQLRAEVEALRQDAERLDWLIEQGNVGCLVQEGTHGFWMAWLEEHDSGRHKYQDGHYATGRKAIDAAMTAKEGQP